MDSFGKPRRDLLWELGGLDYREQELDIEVPVVPATMPSLSQKTRMGWEYELLGLAPGDHVMRLYRARMQAQGVLTSEELGAQPAGQTVRVAGLAVIRQRPPTAKGHVFITLEDETGLINLIVRPNVYRQFKDALRNAPLLWAKGRLQREGLALSVLVYQSGPL